ncbi:MAG: ABC transporter substrate-binding protein [Phycisphaerales bacterium]|nr:ABC transporter substrate-binding protein [Phycisphaerales bacterium]
MKTGWFKTSLILAGSLLLGAGAKAAKPLTIAYSDWPGWVAWQVAIDKGWFKKAGVNVKFIWFDYSPSLDAFTAGKVDAVCVTNGDCLAVGAGGAPSTCIVINDYSYGNDCIIAQPGIKSLKDLKGKKVGVEVGLVDNLLLDEALAKVGMTEKDIHIVNMPTNNLPQAFASGGLDAIAAWQPNAGNALRQVPGSKAIFTSRDLPGLIYDGLYVNRANLAKHKAEWAKVVKIWFKCVTYIKNPKTQAAAIKMMSARDGLTPAQYKAFLYGTKLHDLKMDYNAMKVGTGFTSIYGSSHVVDKFNVEHGVYKTLQFTPAYIDPEFVNALAKEDIKK